MLQIKNRDIRDSIIYLVRYCLNRHTYAVSTAQDILYYNREHFSEGDLRLYIRDICEARDEHKGTVCPLDKSWDYAESFLREELRLRGVKNGTN